MTPPMQGPIAYLRSEKAGEQADFYIKAFAAVDHDRRSTPDGRVMHCYLVINNGALMISDAFPEHGYAFESFKGFSLTLVVDDANLWWTRAVEAGCTVTSELKVEFWGDRFGTLVDPYGVNWAINEPAKKA